MRNIGKGFTLLRIVGFPKRPALRHAEGDVGDSGLSLDGGDQGGGLAADESPEP